MVGPVLNPLSASQVDLDQKFDLANPIIRAICAGNVDDLKRLVHEKDISLKDLIYYMNTVIQASTNRETIKSMLNELLKTTLKDLQSQGFTFDKMHSALGHLDKGWELPCDKKIAIQESVDTFNSGFGCGMVGDPH